MSELISELIDTLPTPDNYWFGVGIQSISENFNHCGVVYYDMASDENKILHLGWHDSLRLHKLTSGKYRWVKLTELFDEDNARDFSNMCKWIYETNKDNTPYGVNFDGAMIDIATREIDLSKGEAVGLTCATFTMLVFETFGISLVDSETWKARPSDIEWHAHIVKLLRETNVPEPHVNIVEKEIPCARIRPEEISASCAISDKPASFEAVEELSLKVHAELRE